MQPFDYRIAVQDPLQMALAGYQQGQQFQNQRVQAERETQLYDMEMQQYQANQAKLQEDQARAQAMQADLGQFADDLEAGRATRDKLNRLQFLYGDIMGEHVGAAYEGKTQEYKDVQASKIARIGIAFTRSPEEGMRLLQVEKEAAQNAGDKQLLDSIEMMEGEAQISPGAPTASALFVLSTLLPPDQFEAYKAMVLPERPELPAAVQTFEALAERAGIEPGTPEYARAAEEAMSGGGQTINVGGPAGGPQFGPTPAGTMTITDPTSPTGYRNVPIPGSPLATEAQGATRSRSSLENTFESMFLGYKDLQTSGAIRDVGAGVGANIAAYMQTSPLGREIGKATGSPAEATREAIEALQPSISQAIMAQPGMSAKGMDSERELAFFIKSITAPTTDVNTNYATLHALDMRFGNGQLLKKMVAQKVITPEEYKKITRSKRISSVLGQLDEKVDQLFTMDETAAPAVPSRLQQYFGGD
jgi:hypothetical protein